MKTCPVCALDLEDTYLFCPDDGSSLDSLAGRISESASTNASESDDETAGAVVLYCPACAAEYPLTFSTCPVHGLQLTRHPIPRRSSSRSVLDATGANGQAAIAGLGFQQDQSKRTEQVTQIDLRMPQIASQSRVPPIETARDDCEIAQDAGDTVFDPRIFEAGDAFGGGVTAFDYPRSLTGADELRRMERPGFRVAAIATVIALAIFGLVAIYTLVSNLSRRSSSYAVKVASNAPVAAQSLPFVATPQEAQNYKEEAAISEAPAPPQPQTVRPADTARIESPISSKDAARKTAVSKPATEPSVTSPPAATPRVSNPPMPALPRGNSGGFDARLIRVRSRKTQAGFRYDLTFNMQEQAGRSTQWQRVLISTRSANGTSHSEAIPFSHRLGAAGALTFTISVELTGHSEADWQGRIVCTTLGWDNKGAPLQAIFGADVTP